MSGVFIFLCTHSVIKHLAQRFMQTSRRNGGIIFGPFIGELKSGWFSNGSEIVPTLHIYNCLLLLRLLPTYLPLDLLSPKGRLDSGTVVYRRVYFLEITSPVSSSSMYRSGSQPTRQSIFASILD